MASDTVYEHTVVAMNADKFKDWIANRGGVAVWDSINLSNPGASWSTPALTIDGKPYEKPTWQAGNVPVRVVTDPSKIGVITAQEVKRFHIAVRMGSQGLSLKVTDGGTRRIRKAVAAANDKHRPTERDCWYEFDYSTQEAVIMAPSTVVPLSEWKG